MPARCLVWPPSRLLPSSDKQRPRRTQKQKQTYFIHKHNALSVCLSVCVETNEASRFVFSRSKSLANVPHQSRLLDWYVRIHIEGDTTTTTTTIVAITDTITTTTAIVMIVRRSFPAREPGRQPSAKRNQKATPTCQSISAPRNEPPLHLPRQPTAYLQLKISYQSHRPRIRRFQGAMGLGVRKSGARQGKQAFPLKRRP